MENEVKKSRHELWAELSECIMDDIIDAETKSFDKGYNSGFDDAVEQMLKWIVKNQSKFIWGLQMGLENSGVADELREALSK